MLIGGAGALAGTTGTIVGTVVDALGDPISGVTVTLNDPGFTAKTNAAGEYVILNIPSGTYSVKAFHVHYQSVVMSDVVVSADRRSVAHLQMGDLTQDVEEVLVVADSSAHRSEDHQQPGHPHGRGDQRPARAEPGRRGQPAGPVVVGRALPRRAPGARCSTRWTASA